MAQKTDNTYDGSQIQVLEGLEPVRKRPGMYIGSTGYDGVHHLIKEIADNSVDEAIAGFATKVEITILADGGLTVTDNGRGIPVDKHPKTGLSTLETVLTVLHAGGKFGGGGYKVSSGLHGVGSSVVNALSTHMIAEVVQKGELYRVEFERGGVKVPFKKVGKTDRPTGTSILSIQTQLSLKKQLRSTISGLLITFATKPTLQKVCIFRFSTSVPTNEPPFTLKVVSKAM